MNTCTKDVEKLKTLSTILECNKELKIELVILYNNRVLCLLHGQIVAFYYTVLTFPCIFKTFGTFFLDHCPS